MTEAIKRFCLQLGLKLSCNITYYQFVLRVKDGLPVTMRKKYRKETRALTALKTFKKNGVGGALLTRTDETLVQVLEF